MIEFIFTYSPGMQDYYNENMARQYFSPFALFFSKLIERQGLFINFLTFHSDLSLIALVRPGRLWGASSSLRT